MKKDWISQFINNEYQIGVDFSKGKDETVVVLKRKNKVIILKKEDYIIRGNTIKLNKNPKDFFNPSMKRKKKKGETRHHISYNPEIIVILPSKGVHRIITSFQGMLPTKQNIKYLKNTVKAIRYIIKEKEALYRKTKNEYEKI